MEINNGLGNVTNSLAGIYKQNVAQSMNTSNSLVDILNQTNNKQPNNNQSNNNQSNGTITGLGALSFNNQMNKPLENYDSKPSSEIIKLDRTAHEQFKKLVEKTPRKDLSFGGILQSEITLKSIPFA